MYTSQLSEATPLQRNDLQELLQTTSLNPLQSFGQLQFRSVAWLRNRSNLNCPLLSRRPFVVIEAYLKPAWQCRFPVQVGRELKFT